MDSENIINYLNKIGSLMVETLSNQLLKYHTTSSDGKRQFTLRDSRIINGGMSYKTTHPKTNEYTLVIQMSADDEKDYSVYIDEGRKPGKMPPKKPVEEWMKRHNIPLSASYPIRKKISIRGIDARPFLGMATKRLIAINGLVDRIADSSFDEIQIEFGELITRLENSKITK